MRRFVFKNPNFGSCANRSGSETPGCESIQANALHKHELTEALKGASVVFILIGLEYKYTVWEKNWPLIMRNILEVCHEQNLPVVFFDNVYMYGKQQEPMTENTVFNPCSKKGKVRAEIANNFLESIQLGRIKGIIARSADFYGPYSEKLSFFHIMVIQNLLNKKPAQWMLRTDLPHSFTFTIDAAEALYLLVNDERAWNQTWHLPTAQPAQNGEQLIEMAARIIGVKPNKAVFGKTMLSAIGWFVPAIRESMEMLYQFEFPYLFNSDKFNNHFQYTPVSYEEGIRKSIEHIRKPAS